MTGWDFMLFGVYPYVCGAVFLLGSYARFERAQYGWRAGSSQLLRRRQLSWGSNLFHIGIIALFFGHLIGLLTPEAVFKALGISVMGHQILAVVAGGIFAVVCLAGLALLTYRRLADPRIRRTSSASDIFVLIYILAVLLMGMATVPFSVQHISGENMVRLAGWAKAIVTFQPDAAAHMAGINWVYRAHVLMGLTLFLVFPFTRLVHVWSAPVWFLFRRWQVVRRRPGGTQRG